MNDNKINTFEPKKFINKAGTQIQNVKSINILLWKTYLV
jgi:hypothetical protein